MGLEKRLVISRKVLTESGKNPVLAVVATTVLERI